MSSRSTIALALSVVMLALAAGSPAAAEEARPDAELVNLGRLFNTAVSASSVNGNRSLADKHYGVRNLFDDGSNVIDDINYTTWLSDAAPRHWVKLGFRKPVAVHAVLVETAGKNRPTEYALDLSRVTDDVKRIVKEFDSIRHGGFRTTYQLPEPVADVSEVTIIFPGPEMIEVSEIKVTGTAPEGTSLTPCKPLILFTADRIRERHTIEIERTIRTDEDRRLIEIAESAYPPREDVVEAIKTAHFKLGSVPDEAKLWWFSSFDNVRIPYAITAEAVDYYTGLMESYRKKTWTSDIQPSSKFEYKASVELKKSFEKDGQKFEDVHVVEMKLSFGVGIASAAALHFSKERTVVLDGDGKVLAIFGDGKTDVMVA